jgi:hypothetical protein
MKKKIKWNYAVMRSIFGDYWIGKTKLTPIKEIIFTDIKDAIEKAQELFKLDHPDFNPDLLEDDENNDDELLMDYKKISGEDEEDKTIEIISKGIEKFIVK